jgi:hypothetical protein
MIVRVCPACGYHNAADAFNCVTCGATLSIKTLIDTDTQKPPPESIERPPSDRLEELLHDMLSSDAHRRKNAVAELDKRAAGNERIVNALRQIVRSDNDMSIRELATTALLTPGAQSTLRQMARVSLDPASLTADFENHERACKPISHLVTFVTLEKQLLARLLEGRSLEPENTELIIGDKGQLDLYPRHLRIAIVKSGPVMNAVRKVANEVIGAASLLFGVREPWHIYRFGWDTIKVIYHPVSKRVLIYVRTEASSKQSLFIISETYDYRQLLLDLASRTNVEVSDSK